MDLCTRDQFHFILSRLFSKLWNLREPSFEALIAWPPSLNFDVTMLIIADPSISKVSMAIIILEMCTIHNKYDQVTPVITYQLILDTSCVVGYMIFVTFLRFISSQVFMKDFSESFLISELDATNYKYMQYGVLCLRREVLWYYVGEVLWFSAIL